MRFATTLRVGFALGSLVSAPALAQHRICTLDGAKQNDAFGRSVSSAGDVDRDGCPDLIVGATEGINQRGSAVVYSGRDGRVLYRIAGQAFDDSLGFSVGTAGDLNKDGHDDFLVGATQDCG